ncbi:alcohol oxidase [Flammula alnicola]|nr:alcohol oxidase [Flammula alnicola]
MPLGSIYDVSGKTFDFVVIGGGTAGLAVAARLSEDSDVSVLVLEAGAANLDDPLILIPAMFGVAINNPHYDWAFQTVPQETLDGRSLFWPRGKTLGGSSAINYFPFHRPPKSDIDAFEKLGNPGWNWDLLKKYYNKSTGFIPPLEKSELITYNLEECNGEGPLKYSYPLSFSGFEKPYREALKSIGIDRVEDPLMGKTKGTWISPISIHPKDRTRSYAANMYYTPNADRKNLTVLISAHVAKVELEKSPDGIATATGVRFIYDGKSHSALVRKEVVLSAGAIMSPQILELSGIGDEDILQNAGIEVQVELPGVGANVQEHICKGTTFEVRTEVQDQFTSFESVRDPVERERQRELFKQGKGTSRLAPSCMTFLPLSSVSPEAENIHRDLKESIKAGIDANRYTSGLQKQYKLQLEYIEQDHPNCEVIFAQGFTTSPRTLEPGKMYVSMVSFLNHPFSRGTIHIKSNNPLDPPAIDPHYFEEKYDLSLFVEILKFNRRLVQQEPLKSLLTGKEINPGLEVNTDEDIAKYLKDNFSTTYHTAGSCSMLPLEDGGVVDPKLKVYHTTNIRVADISIIPLHIGAHTHATAYAIGELAADIMKGKV